jgi:hypothetical protein
MYTSNQLLLADFFIKNLIIVVEIITFIVGILDKFAVGVVIDISNFLVTYVNINDATITIINVTTTPTSIPSHFPLRIITNRKTYFDFPTYRMMMMFI